MCKSSNMQISFFLADTIKGVAKGRKHHKSFHQKPRGKDQTLEVLPHRRNGLVVGRGLAGTKKKCLLFFVFTS